MELGHPGISHPPDPTKYPRAAQGFARTVGTQSPSHQSCPSPLTPENTPEHREDFATLPTPWGHRVGDTQSCPSPIQGRTRNSQPQNLSINQDPTIKFLMQDEEGRSKLPNSAFYTQSSPGPLHFPTGGSRIIWDQEKSVPAAPKPPARGGRRGKTEPLTPLLSPSSILNFLIPSKQLSTNFLSPPT